MESFLSHTPAPRFSGYDDPDLIGNLVDAGNHRGAIGAEWKWDKLGALQLSFLKSQGLQPHHLLIDVGAGSFRAGVKLVPYLDNGNYYAIDIRSELLEAGYAREIEPAGLANRFPRCNFTATANFDVSGFGRVFDFGIAQSVFTHMPIVRLNACLSALAPHFCPGGQFFATVHLVPEERADTGVRQPSGNVTTLDNDPYHTTLSALQGVVSEATDWQMTVIGNWGHPGGQQMLRFTRRN